MKKYIILILAICFITPIFAVSKANIVGTWKDVCAVINITSDSIFWDEYTDESLSELIEGDCYEYRISGDTIFYKNELSENNMFMTAHGDLLIITIPHRSEPLVYKKVQLDAYQENKK